MVDLNKNKNLNYETNLTNVGFANWHGEWFGVQYLILDLKIFSDSQGRYSTILLLGFL